MSRCVLVLGFFCVLVNYESHRIFALQTIDTQVEGEATFVTDDLGGVIDVEVDVAGNFKATEEDNSRKGVWRNDNMSAQDVRKSASADVRQTKNKETNEQKTQNTQQEKDVTKKSHERKKHEEKKVIDRNTCNIYITGSTVREDFQIRGTYEYLHGVTYEGRPTYYCSKMKTFLFYLEDYTCWVIGKKAGHEDDLWSYTSSQEQHPLDISDKWFTSLDGEWTTDPHVNLKCVDEAAEKGGGTLGGVDLTADQRKWVEEIMEPEDDFDMAKDLKGYELKNGYLTARDDCNLKSESVGHWDALSQCWESEKCAGVTYQTQNSQAITNKAITVWFKSCIEFHPSKDWISFVKKDDEVFEARTIKIVFHNDLSEDLTLFLQHEGADKEDEEWGILRSSESFDLDVKIGTTWYGNFMNGTYAHKLIVSSFGKSDGAFYAFSEALLAEEAIEQHKQEYLERTGRNWLQIWPRPEPSHPIWDPVEIGHTRTVTTTHHQWHLGESEEIENISMDGDTEKAPLELEMETMSLSPKVFVIKNALSEDECDFIKNSTEGKFVRSKILADQTHKDYDPNEDMVETVSKVRTSTQTWLSSNSSGVVKNIFYRIGDILRLDNNKINTEAICESLQIVHYEKTQEYQPHHDYMEPYFFPDQQNIQRGYNRFATILFYIHPAEEGGGTGFPLAKEGNLEVRLPKGSAVLFYNMLEDGNLDYYSQHAGLPVKKGIKYASNLWIWDPMWGGHL